MKIIEVDQRSPEWFKLREKKMTASHAQEIGNAGKGLETYIKSIMQEYYSTAEKENFSNKHTERGNELEDSAAFLYALETGNEIEKVGFVEYSEFVGCSPDGFVGPDGMVEIKCPDDKAYFELLLGAKPDSKYIWQLQMQLQICQRLWCDLAFYNPNFKTKLLIFRNEPDLKKHAELEIGYAKGEQMIRAIEAQIKAKQGE